MTKHWNEIEKQYKSPFTIVIIDLLDAYHYADVFDDSRYAIVGNGYVGLEECVELADRLFYVLNPKDRTQEEWCELEAGHDVRIYDSDSACVYKAHERLPKN